MRHRAARRYIADQHHAALEDVERALERNPNSVEGLMLRGALRYDLGHRQEAGADWVLAYRLSPRELQAYLGRYRREIQEQVIAALEAASAPRPGQPR